MSISGQRPLIYLITSGKLTPAGLSDGVPGLLSLLRAAVEVGVPLVQIREKQLPGRQLFELVSKAAELTRGSGTKLLVNDRVDIAIAARADGVHLPSRGLPVADVRAIWPGTPLIGKSTHSVDEVKAAREAGADFAVFGPVFVTPGKGEPRGLDELKNASEEACDMPVLGLGGIDEANCADVLRSGAAGFAAIRALNNEADLARLAGKYLSEQ